MQPVLRDCRGLFLAAALFSCVVNLLMLTGPLFMLLVYDRVLTSRSEETLVALLMIVAFLFAMTTVLDLLRSLIMTRAAARVQSRLDSSLFKSAFTGRTAALRTAASEALADAQALQSALASPAALAVMDLPWAPVFLVALFLLHPSLGILAACGGGLLLCLTWGHRRLSRDLAASAACAARDAERVATSFASAGDMLCALGMADAAAGAWTGARTRSLRLAVAVSDRGAAAAAFSRGIRLFLQSAMLALGAWLALRGQVSAGALGASSLLTSRALAPVEGMVAGWAMAGRALASYRRLRALPPVPAVGNSPMPLPRPRGRVDATPVVLAAGPGAPALRIGAFSVGPGQVLGVVGPSGTGKSTLIKAVIGAIEPLAGEIRLDGMPAGRQAAGAVGYVPQRPTLFPGTVAENIARLDRMPNPDSVVAAALAAGAHQSILGLLHGYETLCADARAPLCESLVRQICLARAFFGQPSLLLLDEPDAGLDGDGHAALVAALRRHCKAGGSAILATHRRSLVQECRMLLALGGGGSRACGPRDAVLDIIAGPVPRRPAVAVGGGVA